MCIIQHRDGRRYNVLIKDVVYDVVVGTTNTISLLLPGFDIRVRLRGVKFGIVDQEMTKLYWVVNHYSQLNTTSTIPWNGFTFCLTTNMSMSLTRLK